MQAFFAQLVKILAQVLLVPFFKWLGESIAAWWARRKKVEEIKDETQGKVDDYENATTVDAGRDTFSKLP